MFSKISFILVAALWLICFGSARAQSTEFTYQGRLLFGDVPANGSYDFEFALFDASTGGNQLGSNFPLSAVNVNNGVFSVRIDFGDQFPGASRFLEIHVRQTGATTYAVLSPRQAISSAPYSIKSLNSANADSAANASQLGGMTADQFVVTSDARLSDARAPLPNSTNYVQNTTSPQPATNFNIAGNGTLGGTLSANIINAATQFSIGGSRILSNAGSSNLFAGTLSGSQNTGPANSFFGSLSGQLNTFGDDNSFFGASSGLSNTSGFKNSFFGSSAGKLTTTGGANSFFGDLAGSSNTTGFQNSFFGVEAGESNTVGGFNVFIGDFAGSNNTTGNLNSAFGSNSGISLTTGTRNLFLGYLAGTSVTTETGNSFIGAQSQGAAGITNATSVGFQSQVTQSNSLILGSVNGKNGATADTRVGIGTTAPAKHLHIFGAGDQEIAIQSSDSGGRMWTVQSSQGGSNGRFEIIDRTAGASRLSILDTGAVGIGTTAPADRLDVNGIMRVEALGTSGSTALCRNASNQISTCSSSIRYKSNIVSFNSGLDMVRRLRPVSFNWKADGSPDFGLVAEDVAKIEPLLVTRNTNGEVEGVKYDRVGVVLINAVNEQQTEIENQQKQLNSQKEIIERQQAEIEALKTLVCSKNRSAKLCGVKR